MHRAFQPCGSCRHPRWPGRRHHRVGGPAGRVHHRRGHLRPPDAGEWGTGTGLAQGWPRGLPGGRGPVVTVARRHKRCGRRCGRGAHRVDGLAEWQQLQPRQPRRLCAPCDGGRKGGAGVVARGRSDCREPRGRNVSSDGFQQRRRGDRGLRPRRRHPCPTRCRRRDL